MNHTGPESDHPEQQTKYTAPYLSRERPISKDWLFHGKDELGREGWFLRIEVTGMHPRRCGPFGSPTEACTFFEEILERDVLGAFGYLKAAMNAPEQACVLERESRLPATSTGAEEPR